MDIEKQDELLPSSKDYANELNSNEFAAMHFGFTPRGFTDQVYNCIVDAWAHTIQTVLLKDPIIKTAENKKELYQNLMDILFTSGGGAFQKYLSEFTHYTSRNVFRIPDSVTLPVHQPEQLLNAEEIKNNKPYSFAQEEKKAKATENDILAKKHALAEVKQRCEEADNVIEKMKKMLDVLKKRKEEEESAEQQEDSVETIEMS